MIYLDSSVALAYLLAEDRYPTNALWDQPVVSSRLLECEIWNRINTRRLADSHGDIVRSLIGRIAMIEMVPPALKRTLEPFPAPFARRMPFTWKPSNSPAPTAPAGPLPREIPGSASRGLYILVGVSGTKSFTCRFRVAGKTRKLTLGRYPALSLADARELA